MKKIAFRWLLSLSCVLAAVGCSDDEKSYKGYIWDFINPSVDFYITDGATGVDLCNPEVGSDVLEGAYVVYKGENYKLLDPGTLYPTRANLALPFALRHFCTSENPVTGDPGGEWFVSFGEFDPCIGYKQEPFEVFWGDGTSTKIELNLYIDWDKNHYPNITDEVWVDGKSNGSGYSDGWVVRIVK